MTNLERNWEMTYLTPDFWDTIRLLLEIFLFGIVLLYMFLNRRGHNRSVPVGHFSSAVADQLIRQEMDRTFARLDRFVTKEHERFHKRLHRKQVTAAPTTPLSDEKQTAAERSLPTGFSDPGADSNLYEEIRALGSAGFNTDEIAGKVDLPKCEIELLLKLNHRAKKQISTPSRPEI
jgi:hypothetical protein